MSRNAQTGGKVVDMADKKDFTADKIVEMILEALDKGVSPWHKGWSGGIMPCSAVTGKPYRGINVFLLGMLDYKVPRYLTFKQCQNLGGRVKKGEHGHIVQFWKPVTKVEKDELTGDEKENSFLVNKYYTVFNVEQCDGLPEEFYKVEGVKEHKPIEEAEEMWNGYADKPVTNFTDGDSAFYVPSNDEINMPKMGYFDSPEEFYATLFHEGVHSTGHEKRLNRKIRNEFGSEKYSEEELTAEIGAQLLCQMCGITTTLKNSAAYCKGWAKYIKSAPKMSLIYAASRAQKAADYIMGKQASEKASK